MTTFSRLIGRITGRTSEPRAKKRTTGFEGWTARDWADLPVYHPARDGDAR